MQPFNRKYFIILIYWRPNKKMYWLELLSRSHSRAESTQSNEWNGKKENLNPKKKEEITFEYD